MNAIYSLFWNKASCPRGWRTNRAALNFLKVSIAQSRNHFDGVILYTDSAGKELVNGLEFDKVVVSSSQPIVTAALISTVRFRTYLEQNAPFIHLDCDFILWKKPKPRLLKTVLVQSRHTSIETSAIHAVLRSLAWKPAFVDRAVKSNSQIVYPCPAVFGGEMHEFISWYSKIALDILHHPRNDILKKFQGEDMTARTVCVMLEQWLLAVCAAEAGVEINYLTRQHTDKLNTVDPRWIPKLGFTHLSGGSKRDHYWHDTTIRLSNKSTFLYPGAAAKINSFKSSKPIDLRSAQCAFMVSMEDQWERRYHALTSLEKLGVKAQWRIPVRIEDIPWNLTPEVYKKTPKYASQLWTLMSIFDEVEKVKAEYFLHFEDDIVLHPEICELLTQVKIPSDWKFIYLGGRNSGFREAVYEGALRSSFVSDLHAVIVKSDIIPDLKTALLDPTINSQWADYRIGSLQWRHPAYICRPNLIWQSTHKNEQGTGQSYSNYYENGSVRHGQGD